MPSTALKRRVRAHMKLTGQGYQEALRELTSNTSRVTSRVIVAANQSRGSGATTLLFHVAAALAAKGMRVAAVDAGGGDLCRLAARTGGVANTSREELNVLGRTVTVPGPNEARGGWKVISAGVHRGQGAARPGPLLKLIGSIGDADVVLVDTATGTEPDPQLLAESDLVMVPCRAPQVRLTMHIPTPAGLLLQELNERFRSWMEPRLGAAEHEDLLSHEWYARQHREFAEDFYPADPPPTDALSTEIREVMSYWVACKDAEARADADDGALESEPAVPVPLTRELPSTPLHVWESLGLPTERRSRVHAREILVFNHADAPFRRVTAEQEGLLQAALEYGGIKAASVRIRKRTALQHGVRAGDPSAAPIAAEFAWLADELLEAMPELPEGAADGPR